MKHAFLNALLFGSVLGSQVWANTNTTAGTSGESKEVIARVTERDSIRSIVYELEGDGDDVSMVFSLKNGERTIRELKRLDVELQDGDLALRSVDNEYNFNIMRATTKASRDAYKWCFTQRRFFDGGLEPAFYGMYPLGVPVVATVALCGVIPAGPFIAGVLLTPIDGTITLINSIFGRQVRVQRKFKKMLRGQDTKASQAVFEALMARIEAL